MCHSVSNPQWSHSYQLPLDIPCSPFFSVLLKLIKNATLSFTLSDVVSLKRFCEKCFLVMCHNINILVRTGKFLVLVHPKTDEAVSFFVCSVATEVLGVTWRYPVHLLESSKDVFLQQLPYGVTQGQRGTSGVEWRGSHGDPFSTNRFQVTRNGLFHPEKA